ncbi:RNA polymerase sigma-70 factor [Gordonia sp. X0973]|uniref:RNA polymerase sigma-70 factor n=1 Tax=Gordonia sp. X0973 TaxID=2742602 RepID=UPI000F544420|nr:RNA polymerase sigma-70 factor [Gordonia sp. X0973]QKT09278.1 RNA polymerase sigma-70 factor [Gordonia sp. X0973]
MDETGGHATVFAEYRPLLFTIAYEILGSAADADDVLQESYLRWADVDLATVDNPRSYLARVVTRQALNAARAASRRREEYVGPWLPEPILLDENDPADDVVLAESVSTAMLVVLETLAPQERAVFLLREVFGFGYDEIGTIVGKSADAVRQTAHRARGHVQARRPRYDAAAAARADEVVHAFQIAAVTGDMDGLLALLAPDAVYTADSDGKASAAKRPIVGADAIARILLGFVRIGMKKDMATRALRANGMPGFAVTMTDDPGGAFWFHVVDGKIAHIYAMRNPEKLGGLEAPRSIAR